MSRVFFYITLSVAVHVVALLPWRAGASFSAPAMSAEQLERRVLAAPQLVTKPAARAVQPVKPSVVEKKITSEVKHELQVKPQAKSGSLPKPKPKPKPPAKPVVQQAASKAVKNAVAKTQELEARQPSSAVAPEQSQRNDEQQRTSKMFATQQPSSAKATEQPVGQEVLSKQPRFASTPAAPVYPAQARRRQQQGTVWLDVRLDARGQLLELQLLHSSGVKSLDQAALAAVKKWQFLPEQQGGIGVPSRVHIPIEFAFTATR
ncbi:energy transducer TonB [Denitrificimonas sp. JX-1]|uniref:Protein TonB n=2 Tax=Denitrificimonas halotolerans TaxID=3098930 RepID=A0ABU5GUM6_9GAMM|nr:energy transducer TonB [Denitrificimonas sp. JX-1]